MGRWYPGQHFDNMVRITENALRDDALGIMRKVFKQAKLFVFDEPAHVITPKEYTKEEEQWYREHLHLPFPVTAVEDPASVVLLKRTTEGDDPTVLPMHNMDLLFYAWVPLLTEDGARADAKDMTGDQRRYLEEHGAVDSGSMVTGVVEKMDTLSGPTIGTYGKVYCVSVFENGIFRNKILGQQIPNAQRDACLTEAKAAIEEVMIINDPSRFILEASPVQRRQKNKKSKSARRPDLSSERSIFTILHPKKIRQQMQLPEPGEGGTPKRGHDVRAHTRTFAHERYTKKRGKTVLIKAHWRGPKENTVGNKKYVVRLDL